MMDMEREKLLLDTIRFIKQFLLNLEGADCGDPLRDLRRRFHAPLHEKLDAALAPYDTQPSKECKAAR